MFFPLLFVSFIVCFPEWPRVLGIGKSQAQYDCLTWELQGFGCLDPAYSSVIICFGTCSLLFQVVWVVLVPLEPAGVAGRVGHWEDNQVGRNEWQSGSVLPTDMHCAYVYGVCLSYSGGMATGKMIKCVALCVIRSFG